MKNSNIYRNIALILIGLGILVEVISLLLLVLQIINESFSKFPIWLMLGGIPLLVTGFVYLRYAHIYKTNEEKNKILYYEKDGLIICRKCLTKNLKGSKYCSQCGNSLFKACKHCGSETEEDSKFCNVCGMRH